MVFLYIFTLPIASRKPIFVVSRLARLSARANESARAFSAARTAESTTCIVSESAPERESGTPSESEIPDGRVSAAESESGCILYLDISGLPAGMTGLLSRRESAEGSTAARLSTAGAIVKVSAGLLNARASGGAADNFLAGPVLAGP